MSQYNNSLKEALGFYLSSSGLGLKLIYGMI